MKELSFEEVKIISAGEKTKIDFSRWIAKFGGGVVGAAVLTKYAGPAPVYYFGFIPVSVAFGGALLGGTLATLLYDLDQYLISITQPAA